MKFLNVPVFIIALSIGLFLSYVINPNTNTIYVYPNPDTENNVLFKDQSDTCFKYNHYYIVHIFTIFYYNLLFFV